MKRKDFIKIGSIGISSLFLIPFSGCENNLDFNPKDRINSANFPENATDIKSLVNGVYSQLRSSNISHDGFFSYGIFDSATPNGHSWGNRVPAKIGRGTLSPSDGSVLTYRWTKAYSIVNKSNFLLEQLENVELDEDEKSTYKGEAYFLRGLAYSVLADSYGRVPIMTSVISSKQARNLSQASVEEVWGQAISDYDVAIANLPVDAPQPGRATKGAALGLKMRAFLYQNKFEKVLTVIKEIEALHKYSLFPSYEGLFRINNENNSEVMFDIQYMRGENGQGSFLNQHCSAGTGSHIRGTTYIPTKNLVESYEMAAEGTELDSDNPKVPDQGPYQGRDPRLYYTVVLPHTEILDHMYPNYIYPGGAFNHPGNRIKSLATRKYMIEHISQLPPAGQSDLNYIVMRYAEVILSKAESLIETGSDVDQAVTLINKIRKDRDDVTLTELSKGMTRDKARKALRHERRIEFAMEGLYWPDIRRWDELDGYAQDIYPIEIRDRHGDLIETKFPNGYLDYYRYLPIPDNELSLNKNLEQNPGW